MEIVGIFCLLLGLTIIKKDVRVGSFIMLLSNVFFIISFINVHMWNQVFLNLVVGVINVKNMLK